MDLRFYESGFDVAPPDRWRCFFGEVTNRWTVGAAFCCTGSFAEWKGVVDEGESCSAYGSYYFHTWHKGLSRVAEESLSGPGDIENGAGGKGRKDEGGYWGYMDVTEGVHDSIAWMT